jgi:O-antigen/teichoic acid export membrane protein
LVKFQKLNTVVAFLNFSALLGRLNLSIHFRELSWVLVAQAAAVLGPLASVKTATSALGPGDYGRFAAVLAIAGILQVCLYGGIAQTAARFLYFASATRSVDDYLRALAMLLALAVGAVLALSLIAFLLGLDGMLFTPNWLLAVFVVGSGSQAVLLGILNAARARKSVALLQIIDAIGRPLLIVLATTWFARNPTAVLAAYVISTAVISTIALAIPFSLRTKLLGSKEAADAVSDKSLFSQMLAYAVPFVMFGIAGAMGSHGERLLLSAWVSWEEVGVYALMSQIAVTPAILLTGLINQFYLPVIFHQDPAGTSEFGSSFRRYLLASGAGIIVLAIAILLVGPIVIPLVSTSAFLGHEHLLGALVLSAGLFGMGQQLVLPGLRAFRSFIYILPKVIHSAVLLLAALLLVPAYGLDGMAASSVVAAALYAISVIVANKRCDVRI